MAQLADALGHTATTSAGMDNNVLAIVIAASECRERSGGGLVPGRCLPGWARKAIPGVGGRGVAAAAGPDPGVSLGGGSGGRGWRCRGTPRGPGRPNTGEAAESREPRERDGGSVLSRRPIRDGASPSCLCRLFPVS